MKTPILSVLMTSSLIVGTLMACTPASPPLEGRNLWVSKNINSYSYVLQRSCFCPPESTKAVRLEVSNGTLISAKYVDSGLDVPANVQPNPFKIEAFFELIDSTRTKGGKVENLKFDPVFGHPTQMSLDPIPLAVDDETAYRLTQFKAL